MSTDAQAFRGSHSTKVAAIDLLRKAQRVLPLRVKSLTPSAVVDLGRFVSLPAGYQATNPSIVRHGGHFLVCVRGVNYVLGRPGALEYSFTSGTAFDTQNRFFLLDERLSFVRGLPGLDRAFAGIEDVKLFSAGGGLYGVGSKSRPAPDGRGGCSMAIGPVDVAAEDAAIRTIESPFGRRQEKNWVPVAKGGSIYFVYSVSPLLLFEYRVRSGELSQVPGLGGSGGSPQALPFLVSGSSPSLPLGRDFLMIAHRRVVRVPTFKRIYVSRAYLLASDLSSAAGGPYFSIGPPCIQFVNGIAATEETVYLSYGEDDRRARLALFDRGGFIEALCPRR